MKPFARQLKRKENIFVNQVDVDNTDIVGCEWHHKPKLAKGMNLLMKLLFFSLNFGEKRIINNIDMVVIKKIRNINKLKLFVFL